MGPTASAQTGSSTDTETSARVVTTRVDAALARWSIASRLTPQLAASAGTTPTTSAEPSLNLSAILIGTPGLGPRETIGEPTVASARSTRTGVSWTAWAADCPG